MHVSPQLILRLFSIVMSLRYLTEVSSVLSSWPLNFQACGSAGEVDGRASYQGYVGAWTHGHILHIDKELTLGMT